MQFRDVIGQEDTKQRLRLSVMEGKLPHAQLFTGPVGVGKLPLVLAYAQYINCPNRTAEDSCGVCPTCLQFAKLQHPDLHFVFPIVKKDGGSSNVVCDDFVDKFRELILSKPYFDLTDWYASLGVENKQGLIYESESGEILRKLSLKAFGEGFKVMIIWQAEKMHQACANKLLKILEEPPERTLFFLLSEQPELLLQTIFSRTQQIRVPRIDTPLVADAIGSMDIARIANGNYVLAQRLMSEKNQNAVFLEDFKALMRNAWMVAHKRKYDALQQMRLWSIEIAEKTGREYQKAFLQYAQRQVRENYIANLQQPDLNYQTEAEKEFSVNFARFIHDGNVELIMNELDTAEQQIAQNGNAKIIFFDLCLQMIVLIKKQR